MGKGHSTPRRRKGVTSVYMPQEGTRGHWVGALNFKRCVLGKGSWGRASRNGVFGFKMDLKFLDTVPLNISVAN